MRKIILLMSTICFGFLAYSVVCAAQVIEEEVGRSNTGSYLGGEFYEYMTKELVYENEDDLYVDYVVRYYITHDGGGGYAYQSGAVELFVNDEYITTFDSRINEVIRGEVLLCGEKTITISKGESHKVELRDASTSADTSINVEGDIFHGVPNYQVDFYDGYSTLLKSEMVLRNLSATQPEVPTKEGYIFQGWNLDFTRVISDLQVNALWVSVPQVFVYDRYFIVGEEISNSEIKSKIYGIDEYQEEQVEGIVYKGLEMIDNSKEGVHKIEVTYTTKLGNLAEDIFYVHIAQVGGNNLVRQISEESVSTISDSSVWKVKVHELLEIIQSNTVIDKLFVENI